MVVKPVGPMRNNACVVDWIMKLNSMEIVKL